MKYFTKEVKIALVAIAGVVLLFFGLNFLKGLSIFSDGHAYNIAFSNVNGLSGSCPIYADGYRVGTVTGISYDYDKQGNIIVTAETTISAYLAARQQRLLPTSWATLRSTSSSPTTQESASILERPSWE